MFILYLDYVGIRITLNWTRHSGPACG